MLKHHLLQDKVQCNMYSQTDQNFNKTSSSTHLHTEKSPILVPTSRCQVLHQSLTKPDTYEHIYELLEKYLLHNFSLHRSITEKRFLKTLDFTQVHSHAITQHDSYNSPQHKGIDNQILRRQKKKWKLESQIRSKLGNLSISHLLSLYSFSPPQHGILRTPC